MERPAAKNSEHWGKSSNLLPSVGLDDEEPRSQMAD